MIYLPSRGQREGAYSKRRHGAPVAIVVHTTGAGPRRRFLGNRRKFPGVYDAALFIYRRIMRAGPHFVVGQGGECVQVAPEDRAAWHVGSKGGRAYRKPPRAFWWLEKWAPALKSPADLAGGKLWRGWSVNQNTIGIEVVPPLKNLRGPWSDDCKAALDSLIVSLCADHGIPRDQFHVITHSDAHPHDRTRRGAPWDPAPEAWEDFLHDYPLAA